MALRRIAKELKEIRNPESNPLCEWIQVTFKQEKEKDQPANTSPTETSGTTSSAAAGGDADQGDPFYWICYLTPTADSIYCGLKIEFHVRLPRDYPFKVTLTTHFSYIGDIVCDEKFPYHCQSNRCLCTAMQCQLRP